MQKYKEKNQRLKEKVKEQKRVLMEKECEKSEMGKRSQEMTDTIKALQEELNLSRHGMQTRINEIESYY